MKWAAVFQYVTKTLVPDIKKKHPSIKHTEAVKRAWKSPEYLQRKKEFDAYKKAHPTAITAKPKAKPKKKTTKK